MVSEPSISGTDWLEYTDTLSHYRLRYPADWIINEESNQRVIIKEPSDHARLTINFLSQSCNSIQATLLGKTARFNYYLVGEFKKQVNGQAMSAYEFLDTIKGIRETHILIPSDNRCYDLNLRHSNRPDQQGVKSLLELMLDSFQLLK
jgi:hypothetical protein